MTTSTSQHILNTAANLLGFCLFVITSMHITNYSEKSMIDEFTSVIAVLLISSCLFSFFAIRTRYQTGEQRLEKVANYLFVISLIGILLIILLITFNLLK